MEQSLGTGTYADTLEGGSTARLGDFETCINIARSSFVSDGAVTLRRSSERCNRQIRFRLDALDSVQENARGSNSSVSLSLSSTSWAGGSQLEIEPIARQRRRR